MRYLLVILAVWVILAEVEGFADESFNTQTIAQMLNNAGMVSAEGKSLNIYSYAIGQIADEHKAARILIEGGLHGDERLTSQFVLWLYERVRHGQSQLNQLAKPVIVDFYPFANPDSYGTSRYNANGVNLNRNFGVLWGMAREPSGKYPFSEPETRAIRDLMIARKYFLAVDIHGYVNWIVAPSEPEHVIAQPFAKYQKWQRILVNRMAELDGYQLKTSYGLADGGAFEDWAFWQNGTLAFCFEIPKPTLDAHPYFDSEDLSLANFLQVETFLYHVVDDALKEDWNLDMPKMIAHGNMKLDSKTIRIDTLDNRRLRNFRGI